MSSLLPPGTRLGRYEILSQLGAGGMGEVYLAKDLELGRKVALKILPSEVAGDPNRMSRFAREAKAASSLNHQNILTIHEVGQAGSTDFIATEFIDGETLRQRLKRGSLSVNETLDVAIQIASALAAAHGTRIVHRDIKPENVMIRSDGFVKVLDFGLAKQTIDQSSVVDADASTQIKFKTAEGIVVGTASYMSPEQARGLDVDERTDIFSLGIVIYEMIAGRLPFTGATAAEIVASILGEKEPAPLARYSNDVPPELERIVSKTLQKNSDRRYQTIKDLLIDLTSLKHELEFARRLSQSTHPISGERETAEQRPEARTITIQTHSFKSWLGVALVLVVISAAAFLYFWRVRAKPSASRPTITSLAVLPLENLSGDAAEDYFADGMTEALINDLAQIRALKVISRTSVMRYKRASKSLPEIARELNVDGVIEGSVQRSGGRVRVTAQLIYAASDTHLWSRSYEREGADILRLQSDVAGAIAEEIRVQVTPDERVRLASSRSIDPRAHEAYLLGRYHLTKLNESDLRQAVESFQRAIEIAPDFAAAYAGLSDAWRERGVWGATSFKDAEPQTRNAAVRAIELDAGSAEAHIALSFIKSTYDWDWSSAENEVRRALEINPGSVDGHFCYAILLMALGRHPEAIREMQRAQQLDPLSSVVESTFGRILYRARRYEEAVPHLKRAIELDPGSFGSYARLGDVYVQLGKYDEALMAYQRAGNVRSLGYAARTGQLYARMGKRKEALAALSGPDGKTIQAAGVYAILGDKDQAFRVLNDAITKRESLIIFFKEDPTFDNLYSDPRWRTLLSRMNFPLEN
jgi:eukaryotic-like serine/threonine-protein kinase